MRILRRGLPVAFALLGFAAPALAQTNDPSFRVNNRTNTAINEIYVSSSNDNTWGRDHLGQNVLAAGQSFIVRLPQGQCINDIRFVFADGRQHEQRRVDTCQIVDYNIQ